ncbi:hypothetical protein [Campylobacter blaseri]|nr:hypothetical protein [Campylobacter blaseri]
MLSFKTTYKSINLLIQIHYLINQTDKTIQTKLTHQTNKPNKKKLI